MILVRAWIRQALGASGAAVLVPAAMLGVLAALTLSGGLGRIGNIGQAFSGPRLRAHTAQAPPSDTKVGAHQARLLAALGSGATTGDASPTTRKHGTGASSGRPAPHPGPSGGSGGQGGPGRGSGGTGAPSGGAPGGGGSGAPSGPDDPSPAHRPSPGPSPVTRVTGVAASAAGRLPAPLGPAAGQTVETIGSAAAALVPSVPVEAPVQAPSQTGVRLPAQGVPLASLR